MRLICYKTLSIFLLFGLAGCTLSDFKRSSQLDIRERELNAREQALVLRESMADRRAATLKALDEKLQGDANVESAVNYRLGKSLYWLQEARSNQCYAATYAPPQFKKVNREVLVREAASQFIVDQAKFVEETIELTTAYRVKAEHPLASEAQYETVAESIEIVPAHDVIIEIDPEFADKQISAVTKPAHQQWQSCTGDDNETKVGRLCVIQQAAEVTWLKREVLTGKAAVIRDRRAAEYQTVEITRPTAEFMQKIDRSDLETTVTRVVVKKITAQPKAKRALLPSRSDLIEVQQLAQPARVEWQRVLCEADVAQLKAFQLALADELRANKVNINPVSSADDFKQALYYWQGQKQLPLSWPYISTDSLKLLAVPLE